MVASSTAKHTAREIRTAVPSHILSSVPVWHSSGLSQHHSFCCLLQRPEASSLSCHQHFCRLFAACNNSSNLLLIYNGDCVWGYTQRVLMLSHRDGHCEGYCKNVSFHVKPVWREDIRMLLSSWTEKIKLIYAAVGHMGKWDKAPASKAALCEYESWRPYNNSKERNSENEEN